MSRKRLRPWLIGLAVLAAITAFKFGHGDLWLRSALGRIQSLGPWGHFVFVALYVTACVALLPASVLTLGAGAAFGLAKGFALVSISATLGASAAFLLGRGMLRDWVVRCCGRMERMAALDQAVSENGFKVVFLLRLSPVIPFNLLNFALGLSPVRFGTYVLASWLGMMPGTLLYVYLGSAAGQLGTREGRGPWEWALLGLGLAATLAVSVLGARLAKQALSRAERGQA